LTAHWGIEDPAAVEGDGQRDAFTQALRFLRRRIELFLALPLASLDAMTLQSRLSSIGREAGATGLATA
jgi:arsenate reductase